MPDEKRNIIVMNGEEFEIGEPDVFHMIRLTKVLGHLGLRSEKLINRFADSPSDNATIFSVLAALSESDLRKVAAAVFQFDDEREGIRYFKEHGLKLTPLTQAIVLNIEQADDVATAFEVFTQALPDLLPALVRKLKSTDSEEVGETEEGEN